MQKRTADGDVLKEITKAKFERWFLEEWNEEPADSETPPYISPYLV